MHRIIHEINVTLLLNIYSSYCCINVVMVDKVLNIIKVFLVVIFLRKMKKKIIEVFCL